MLRLHWQQFWCQSMSSVWPPQHTLRRARPTIRILFKYFDQHDTGYTIQDTGYTIHDTYSSTAVSPADCPHQLMLAGGALDSEGSSAVPLASVLTLGPRTYHVLGDLAVVVERYSLAATVPVRKCHRGAWRCRAGGVWHDGHVHLPHDLRNATVWTGGGGAPAWRKSSW